MLEHWMAHTSRDKPTPLARIHTVGCGPSSSLACRGGEVRITSTFSHRSICDTACGRHLGIVSQLSCESSKVIPTRGGVCWGKSQYGLLGQCGHAQCSQHEPAIRWLRPMLDRAGVCWVGPYGTLTFMLYWKNIRTLLGPNPRDNEKKKTLELQSSYMSQEDAIFPRYWFKIVAFFFLLKFIIKMTHEHSAG